MIINKMNETKIAQERIGLFKQVGNEYIPSILGHLSTLRRWLEFLENLEIEVRKKSKKIFYGIKDIKNAISIYEKEDFH